MLVPSLGPDFDKSSDDSSYLSPNSLTLLFLTSSYGLPPSAHTTMIWFHIDKNDPQDTTPI